MDLFNEGGLTSRLSTFGERCFFRFGSSPLPFFSSGRRASIMSWLHRCISSLSVFFNSRYRRSELVDTSGIQSEFFALNILDFSWILCPFVCLPKVRSSGGDPFVW